MAIIDGRVGMKQAYLVGNRYAGLLARTLHNPYTLHKILLRLSNEGLVGGILLLLLLLLLIPTAIELMPGGSVT
jgi:hypothetical protein